MEKAVGEERVKKRSQEEDGGPEVQRLLLNAMLQNASHAGRLRIAVARQRRGKAGRGRIGSGGHRQGTGSDEVHKKNKSRREAAGATKTGGNPFPRFQPRGRGPERLRRFHPRSGRVTPA